MVSADRIHQRLRLAFLGWRHHNVLLAVAQPQPGLGQPVVELALVLESVERSWLVERRRKATTVACRPLQRRGAEEPLPELLHHPRRAGVCVWISSRVFACVVSGHDRPGSGHCPVYLLNFCF